MEEKISLCGRILLNCRNELYSLYPFLDGAFASLPPRPTEDTGTIGTDGECLLFSPDALIATYAGAPERLRRGYLHILLHCLYLHPFRRRDRDLRLWNLACDLSAEQLIEREGQGRLALPPDPVRKRSLEVLGNQVFSPEELCEKLENGDFPDSLEAMEAAFLFDDHNLWQLQDSVREAWEHVLSYTSQNRQGGKRAGTRAGDREEQLEEIREGVLDYRKYLRRFAVSREELELDMDSFDYIYYNLGMEQYGNLPLIEPLEYREGRKLSQLVIAIDTSGSCSRQVVRDFLAETYNILSSQENFFRKMEVYLIQCDCLIQNVAVLHSREEWQRESRAITIAGRGGTDFTPVFQYVDGLRQQGKLRDLKGLLYFTDGDGYYPREKPAYETAFVFLRKNEFLEAVPAWARKLLVNDR